MNTSHSKLRTNNAKLLYDASCAFCTASSKQALRLVPAGTLELLDVNDASVQERYRVNPEAAQREMHLVRSNGRVSKGAHAARDILRLSRWAWPLANFWRIPGFSWVADRVYAWVAVHRYLFMGMSEAGGDPAAKCENGACRLYLRDNAGHKSKVSR